MQRNLALALRLKSETYNDAEMGHKFARFHYNACYAGRLTLRQMHQVPMNRDLLLLLYKEHISRVNQLTICCLNVQSLLLCE